MRLHLTSAVRRGLVLTLLVLAIVSFSISRRQPTKTAALVIDTPPTSASLAFNGLGGTIAKEDGTILSAPVPTAPGKRTVHFIVPATAMNSLVCKTIFSAILNGYPSPVLLNFNSVFRDAEEARFMKIAAIHRYLSLKVHDDDLVLVMDAYDTWFQLPFETLVSRYYRLQERDRLAHLAKYSMKVKEGKIKSSHSTGIIVSSSDAAGGDKIDPDVTAADEAAAVSGHDKTVVEGEFPDDEGIDIPPYAEHVIFGADKICWPNAANSPACKNVPGSTLPKDIYGKDTDNDVYDFKNRPRWLNSGNIMGPAKVLKEIYMRAFDIQQRSKIHFSDQLILADIFGKQDLPIRIDYESYLFQTMTHSHSDMLFLYEDQVEEGDDPNAVIDPITGVSSATGARGNANTDERIDDFEDKQLVDAAFYTNTTRRQSDKYLAWNRVSGNLPAVLHFNGPKLPLETWWGKMWWVHDQSPVHRLQRLKYVRKTGGAFVDDDGTVFRPYKELCGKFDMFEFTRSPFDRGRVPTGSSVSLDPEPFVLGMNPRNTPSDVLKGLEELKKGMAKPNSEQKKNQLS
ncbi:hypothetical protein POJ06DRAFT_256764 [Lipomyces tetrasporus]|uniref:Uncharacterized protein n=1 Tax=Lipomyces tetrasporus TaxID=54092 RepID=A0AAD7QQ00_9ASCO|nr:uncharacterized protein POJ06DRAFT_256764 [Lipomyces tetrasporus]KAJ8099358.1 hypothetical protein POJ06DRAFT_256764 [Lipomyces tetrasporus]